MVLEVEEVGGVEFIVLWVHESGDVVCFVFVCGDVMDLDVNVIGDAVGCEFGCQLL